MLSLIEIFEAQGQKTDKLSSHNYVRIYEELFEPIRYGKNSILEIGIASGGSMLAWKEYFGYSNIYGIDNNREMVNKMDFHSRIQGYWLDVGDQIELKRWARDKNFNIVIDDGSHKRSDIYTAFSILWGHVSPDGYYIVEDVAQSTPSHYVIEDFLLHANQIAKNTHEASSITFRPNLVILQKRKVNDPTCPPLGSL